MNLEGQIVVGLSEIVFLVTWNFKSKHDTKPLETAARSRAGSVSLNWGMIYGERRKPGVSALVIRCYAEGKYSRALCRKNGRDKMA